jgi:hypothetical protein
MSVSPIQPFQGIPDDFIRILNERFRQVEKSRQPAAAPAAEDAVEGADRLNTPGQLAKISRPRGTLTESGLAEDKDGNLETAGDVSAGNFATDGDVTAESLIAKHGSNTLTVKAAASLLSLLSAGAQFKLGSSDVSYVKFQANGVDFLILDPINGLVMIGGTSASFPGIKHVGSTVNFRIADDSGDAPIIAAGALLSALSASMPVKTDGSKVLSSGAIDLAGAEVTGTLPLTQGGTSGTSAATARAALGAAQATGVGAFTITLAKLTVLGSNGSLTWTADGTITGYAAPT